MRKLNKDSKILITGCFVSSIGDWLNVLALMAIMAQTSLGWQAVTMLMALRTLPKIIFGPFVAGIIDYIDKKRLLVSINVFQAILVLALPYCTEKYLLIALSFILSTINIFEMPTIQTIIPAVNKREELLYVNTVLGTVNNITSIASPVLSGILLTVFNISTCFYIDSASFFVFAVVAAFVSKLEMRTNRETGNDENAIMGFINNSFKSAKVIIKNIELRTLLAGFFLANLTLGIVYVTEIMFFKNYLNVSPTVYGTFVSAVGVGIMAGSILLYKLSRKHSMLTLFTLGVMLLGISTTTFSLNRNLIFAVFLLLISGIGEGLFTISNITSIQRIVPVQNLSSVFTLYDSVAKFANFSAMLLSIAFISFLNEMVALFLAGMISLGYLGVYIVNGKKGTG